MGEDVNARAIRLCGTGMKVTGSNNGDWNL